MSDDDPTTLRRLDPQVRWLWRLQGAMLGLPGLVAAAVVRVVGAPPAWAGVGLGVAVAGAAGGWWWASTRFVRFRYGLTADTLRVRDGVLVHTDSAMPLFRVQHIDIDQGPVERWLDLATLTVHTAAPAADATVPGVSSRSAADVRDEILAASRDSARRFGLEDLDAV